MSAGEGFAVVNGVSVTLGEARSLALRLALHHPHDAGGDVAASLDNLAEHGGETTVAGAQAHALAGALQEWLDETNENVLGERLLELRRRLDAETGE